MNHAQSKEETDFRKPTYVRCDISSAHLTSKWNESPSSLVDLATDGAAPPSTPRGSLTGISMLGFSANDSSIRRNMTFDESDETWDDLCLELGQLTHDPTSSSPILDQPADTASEITERLSSSLLRSQRLSYFFAPIPSPRAHPTASSVALNRKRKADHPLSSDDNEARHMNKHAAISEI